MLDLIDLVDDRKADKPAEDICLDLDEDCHDVSCKLTCWLYDPIKGRCPWL